jgi:putative addiction module component (TIGR02574 family)
LYPEYFSQGAGAVMSTVDDILSAAMSLPPDDRAEIANRLFESLDEEAFDRDLHPAWEEELSDRVKSIEDGSANFVDGRKAIEEIRDSLRRGGS